jgi:hypothetical protein
MYHEELDTHVEVEESAVWVLEESGWVRALAEEPEPEPERFTWSPEEDE